MLAHDPAARSGFHAGTLADGTPVELDDELREAEEVVIVGRLTGDRRGGLRGGPALLWPGLASARARTARARRCGLPPAALAERRAHARRWRSHRRISRWSGALDDPPRVTAGEPAVLAVFGCVRARGLSVGIAAAPMPGLASRNWR